MTHDPDLDRWPSLRREVDPLPGGITRLRAGLDQERRRRPWVVGGALATAAAIALALIVSVRSVDPDGDPRRAARELLAGERLPHPDAVALGLAEPAPQPVGDPRVPGGGAIVFVWVEARPPAAPAPIAIAPVDVADLER